MSRSRRAPILVCCHHKVGTRLLDQVFRDVAAVMDWSFSTVGGLCTGVPPDADVLFLNHSLVVDRALPDDFAGVHIVRDPRDVIVSGYLYHRRTTERWCTNTDFGTDPPIRFPQVPVSQQHRPEGWKQRYLWSLQGRSYQQNLLERSQTDGLLFEMAHYGRWTIEAMRDWDYHRSGFLEMRFEDLMADYDHWIATMFTSFGCSPGEVDRAVELAARHDLSRMEPDQIARLPHVSSARPSRWQDYFEPRHEQAFRRRFGSVLSELGYANGP